MNVKEDMLKKKKEINEKTEIFIFVFLAFILLTTWAMTQPFNSGPDEQMRYYVADYIYKHHGALPGGDDPAVRNKVWGISYAYYPVVSYMVSALFMRISRLFADPGYSMFKIARMADVLFVTGAVYFVVKASGKLFPKEKYSREVRWLFAALAGFMPQAIFMGTYVNTDSLALLAAAMILYAWASYLREDWTWKNCILLAVGMAVFTYISMTGSFSLVYVGVLFVALIPAYVALTVLRSHSVEYLNGIFEMKNSHMPIFITQPYMYIANNYDNFNCMAAELKHFSFGLKGLFPLWALTGLKFIFPSLADFPLFVTKEELTTVTLFYDAFYDFGVVGMVFFGGLLGGVCYLLGRFRRKLTCPAGHVIYAQIAMYMMLSFFPLFPLPIFHTRPTCAVNIVFLLQLQMVLMPSNLLLLIHIMPPFNWASRCLLMR